MSITRQLIGWLAIGLCLSSCNSTNTKQTTTNKDSTIVIDKPAVVTARSGLTLRKTPKEGYEQAWLLPYHSIIKVNQETSVLESHHGVMGKWYKASYLDKSGYVFGGYLRLGTAMHPPDSSRQAVEKIFATNMQGVVERALVNVSNGLMLRKLPTTNAESIVIIPQGEEVGVLQYLKTTEVVEQYWGNWCKVRYGKKEGYLFSGFLTFTKAQVVNEEGAKLRKKANIESKMELWIPANSKVFLLSDVVVRKGIVGGVTGVWYKAAYQNKQGYLFSPDLKIQGY